MSCLFCTVATQFLLCIHCKSSIVCSGAVWVWLGGGILSFWVCGVALRHKWSRCVYCKCLSCLLIWWVMWRQTGVDVALYLDLRSAFCHTNKSAKHKNKHLHALRDSPVFKTHTAHTLPTDLFGGYVCRVTAVAQIVYGHKTSPVFECEEQDRTLTSEEKGAVMPFFPRKMPQIYFGYNYLFDWSKETVNYASTMHMIHDDTQPKSLPLTTDNHGKWSKKSKKAHDFLHQSFSLFHEPDLHPCNSPLNTHPSFISPLY